MAETIDGQRALCAGARSIADEVVLAVVKGAPETGIADKAYDIELPAGEPVENAAAGVIAVYNAENPDVVLVEPTPRDKILAGLLAASLGASVISDVTAIDGDVVTNMYFGGLAENKQKANGAKIYTIAATCFDDAEPTGTDTVETIAYTAPEKPLVLRGTKEVPRTGADLTKVDVVVGAGRGFAEEDELQIAPKAYIALGISGQMQHMVGVTGADTIIAVNKDANAPIFKQADYGIVGDIKTVVPALIEKL